ncbi:MAG: NAD(P)-dependent oxidoreductase [Flexistipes sinusarabici]|uniref:NAD(P)-dependent oxidoreductase n=1 Tax=Flexistipes sinusarabici TaxID=2352 RepID=A0A5D0MM37_FLESI|nr:NAD(P)-dependent oxidoreductase [Flexistipes sinusarabici]TYB34724.1 MAG: NAD(P)-dependent oxidoreductase [Flexistipes sinusarabici]
MKIGLIGLGKLGSAMAKRLDEQGHELIVYNRTLEKAEKSGFKYVKSPAELAEKDVKQIIINVYDSKAVNDILGANNGLLEGNLKNKIIIDTTTNHFDSVPNFHRLVKNAGGNYLEAPVIGSVIPAEKGMLMIVVSGDIKAYEQARVVFDSLGSKIFHFPETGKATKIKLINNMVLASFMATLSEAVSMAEKAGFSKDEAVDLLAAGAGESKILNGKKAKLLSGDFSPHFSTRALVKDLEYMEELAYSFQQPALIGGLLKQMYTMTGAKGNFNDDFAAIYDLINNN